MGSRGGSPKASPSGQASSAHATAAPSTPSEWLCYTLLEHANLLQYYHTFIAQGGDDVPQLMEAGEEEFLEIMALVGMAQKPLHVRRLQKALHEYSLNPARFTLLAGHKQTAHSLSGIFPPPGLPPAATRLLLPAALPASTHHQTPMAEIARPRPEAAVIHHRDKRVAPTATAIAQPVPVLAIPPVTAATTSAAANAGPSPAKAPRSGAETATTAGSSGPGTSGGGSGGGGATGSESAERPEAEPPRSETGEAATSEFDWGSEGSLGPNPGLSEEQMSKIRDCAAALITSVPHFELKLVQNKKKISPALLNVINLPASGSQAALRLEEFRRYAAIYGRFDAKRRADKVLTLHEVSVNEAAAQVALLRPALLTRRDELFPLARQVVKDAGYTYSKALKRPEEEEAEGGGGGGGSASRKDSTASSRSQSPASPALRHAAAVPVPPAPVPPLVFPPGTSGLQQLGQAAALMQNSPSSGTSQGSVGSGLPATPTGTAIFLRRHAGLSHREAAERLAATNVALARLAEAQVGAQRRALGLNDIAAAVQTSAELKGLSQRHVELLNERAALELVLREAKEEPTTSDEEEDESGHVEVEEPQPLQATISSLHHKTSPPSTESGTRVTRLASKRLMKGDG